jgi:hypothetical protein
MAYLNEGSPFTDAKFFRYENRSQTSNYLYNTQDFEGYKTLLWFKAPAHEYASIISDGFLHKFQFCETSPAGTNFQDQAHYDDDSNTGGQSVILALCEVCLVQYPTCSKNYGQRSEISLRAHEAILAGKYYPHSWKDASETHESLKSTLMVQILSILLIY